MTIVAITVFLYALLSMTFIREVAIPYIYPSALGGHLPNDAYYYHSLALDQTAKLSSLGMNAFELRPEGQGVAGIASLLYLVSESPYVILIFNSVLHVISIVILIRIITLWFPLRTSIISALPLALSPYMILWFSQVNKESYMLLGIMLYVYGIVQILLPPRKTIYLTYALCFTVSGIMLIWLVRPYVNQILLPFTGLIFFLAFLSQTVRKRNSLRIARLLLSAAIVLVCLGLFTSGAASDATLARIATGAAPSVPENSQSLANECLQNVDPTTWNKLALLPDHVDRRLRGLMTQRCLTFTLLELQSNSIALDSILDQETLPAGAKEALLYLPRAAIIGILSPWPIHWLYSFKERLSIFYTITSIESIMVHLSLVGLAIFVPLSGRWLIAVPLVLALSSMTVIGMATPYIGAVYRYRYPWWMLIIGLGSAAWITLFTEWKRNKL